MLLKDRKYLVNRRMTPAEVASLRVGKICDCVHRGIDRFMEIGRKFMSFTDWWHLTITNSGLYEIKRRDKLPKAVLEVPPSKDKRREFTLKILVDLAPKKNTLAMLEILSRLRCLEEKECVQGWTIDAMLTLTVPGESWALQELLCFVDGKKINLRAHAKAWNALEILGDTRMCEDALDLALHVLAHPPQTISEGQQEQRIAVLSYAISAINKMWPFRGERLLGVLQSDSDYIRTHVLNLLQKNLPLNDTDIEWKLRQMLKSRCISHGEVNAIQVVLKKK